jgi:hypothetical protein
MRFDSSATTPRPAAHLFWRTLAVGLALWCAASTCAWAIEKITLWPTILFLRG